MTARLPEADRLHRARMVFQRAIADGVSMAEAKRRIEADRVELRRRARAEVGRWRDAPVPNPHQAERPRYWWQVQ